MQKSIRKPLRRALAEMVALVSSVVVPGCAANVVPGDGAVATDVPVDVPRSDAGGVDAGDRCAPVTSTGCSGRYVARSYPCGVPAEFAGVTAPPSPDFCSRACAALPPDVPHTNCQVSSTSTGAWMLICGFCGGGRLPAGWHLDDTTSAALERGTRASTRPGGELFAQMAAIESASVTAFRRLARELDAHGAPARLVRACVTAADEERVHARAMRALAVRAGARAYQGRVARTRRRSLEALALENTREGCVRELFGALLAAWQSVHAGDHAVRRVMKQIARDEARHAEISLAIDAWARTKLDERARARLDAAHSLAWRALEGDCARPIDGAVRTEAGLPDPAAMARLYAQAELAFSRRIYS